MAVAKAYINGWTVGNVDIPPLQIEYGSGHNRIMQSNFNPSCFRVKDRALKRLSFATSRSTYFRNRNLDARKEHNDPSTAEDASINHPSPMP